MDMQIPGFRLQRQIGKGGMAVVYAGIQENFERPVAIKVLSPHIEAEKEYAERFMREAKTVATLNHPHIIPVYDVGQIGSHYYIAMEYLPGNTLKHWITTGLEVEECLQILLEVADALSYAHKKGIVHRDIKPENIMFREDNSVVLTDFGIARSSKADQQLTQEGAMIGTPAYMSPEQARGKAVDGRSDIYSLGVVFYEMLMRERPFQGSDPMATALAHLTEPVPRLPGSLAAYQVLLNQMLAKKADERFANCIALSKAVKLLLHPEAPTIVVPPQAAVEAPSAPSGLQMTLAEMEPSPAAVPVSGFRLPAKNLVFNVADYRRSLLRKASRVEVTLVSEDVAQFNVQFSQVTRQLLAWHDEYGARAGAVDFCFYCKAWMLDSVQQTIGQLLQAEEPFEFLKKVDMAVKIHDLAGNMLESA